MYEINVVSSIEDAVHFLYENGAEHFHVCITHSGVFHGDDAIATAIVIRYVHDNWRKYCGPNRRYFLIVRTNCTVEEVQELKNEFPGIDDFILTYDVGKEYDPTRNLFDHHQDNAPIDPEDGHKFAAAGQLWQHFYGSSDDPCTQYVYKSVKKALITPVDVQDNSGKNRNMISDTIKDMNVQWDDDPEDYCSDGNFENAVDFALTALRTAIHKAKSMWHANNWINNFIDEVRPYEGGGTYIVDEENLPPQEVFKAKKAAYLVQPSTYQDGYWQVMARPGLKIDYNITPNSGCTFVHQNRFLATYNNKDAATAAAEANLYGKLQERLAKENKGA